MRLWQAVWWIYFTNYLFLINLISSKMLPTKQAALVRSWLSSFSHQEGMTLHVSPAEKMHLQYYLWDLRGNSYFSITDPQLFTYNYNYHKWDWVMLFPPVKPLNTTPSTYKFYLVWWTNITGTSENVWPWNVYMYWMQIHWFFYINTFQLE